MTCVDQQLDPALSDPLSYVTFFYGSLGRSHKTGLTVYTLQVIAIE